MPGRFESESLVPVGVLVGDGEIHARYRLPGAAADHWILWLSYLPVNDPRRLGVVLDSPVGGDAS